MNFLLKARGVPNAAGGWRMGGLALSLFALAPSPHSLNAASEDLVHLLRTPGGGLQPRVAVDARGNVHMVYLQGDPKSCDVFYCVRQTGGTSFSTPIRVNSEPGSAIAIGAVRGAQLALGREGRVHVAWNGSQPARDPGAKGCPMLYSRLNKASGRFEPQRNLMTSTMNLDGGGSVAADSRGNVYVVWHGNSRTGPDDEEHRAVYLARSTDDGATFSPESKVSLGDQGVCGCCGLKAFAPEQGALAILYRAADQTGNRDSMLLTSRDGGARFESTLLGKWRSSTCPMSTPDLGVGWERDLVAMWETQGQVYRRSITSPNAASPSSAVSPKEDPGNRKHPVFALNRAHGAHLLVAWVEGTGWEKGGTVAWECIDLTNHSQISARQPGVPAWSFAAAAPNPDGTFTIVY